MVVKLRPFDPEAHFRTEAAQAELLVDAFESGDPAYLTEAMAVIARARGLPEDARRAQSRSNGESLGTFLDLAKQLGVKLATAA